MSNLANGMAGQAADSGVSEPQAAGRGELSGPQLAALALLQEGQPFKTAAERAGVNRSTLYRWIRQHAAFAAAYNAWQQELAESARARMLTAAHLAVERVIRFMEIDEDLAFKVIKEMGILRPRAAGQINAERVRREMELEQRELARRLDESAEPPAKRVVSQVTTAPNLLTTEPVTQAPPPAVATVVTSETVSENATENRALK